jgi:hypothetical protein
MEMVMVEKEVLDMEVMIILNLKTSTKKKRWNNLKMVADVSVAIRRCNQPKEERFDKLKFTIVKVD